MDVTYICLSATGNQTIIQSWILRTNFVLVNKTTGFFVCVSEAGPVHVNPSDQVEHQYWHQSLNQRLYGS